MRNDRKAGSNIGPSKLLLDSLIYSVFGSIGVAELRAQPHKSTLFTHSLSSSAISIQVIFSTVQSLSRCRHPRHLSSYGVCSHCTMGSRSQRTSHTALLKEKLVLVCPSSLCSEVLTALCAREIKDHKVWRRIRLQYTPPAQTKQHR